MKVLKSLGLKFESFISIYCLENEKSANFVFKDIAKDFSVNFSKLTENLVIKLRKPPNKYGVLSLAHYYRHLRLTKKIDLLTISVHSIQIVKYIFRPQRCVQIMERQGLP